MYEVLGKKSEIDISFIGTRHGEKVFESLLSQEERAFAGETDEYFSVPLDTRSLDYDIYFERGDMRNETLESFNSHNTYQLSVNEVVKLLSSNREFEKLIAGKR